MKLTEQMASLRNLKLLVRLSLATALAVSLMTRDTVAQESGAEIKPVLMVIANQDFYWAEYGATRASLEAAGLEVVVAATTTDTALPQDGGHGAGAVQPDLALSDVEPRDYDAVVFIGGWGSSMYQYDFPGTYDEPDYNLAPRLARLVNYLIEDFVLADKPTAGIGHGVSVLAWARVDGQSPLRGRIVVGDAGGVPGFRLGNASYPPGLLSTRWHIEQNGGTMLTSRSVGDPLSSTDDVFIDGKIITAENYDSASVLAEALKRLVLAEPR